MKRHFHRTFQIMTRRSFGQSSVEMALAFTILIPLLVGAVDLGRAYFAYDLLVHAVNEGARRASFDTDTSSIVSVVQAAADPLTIPVGNVTITCYSGATTTTKTCASVVIGDSIKVAGTLVFTPITPLVTAMLPGGILTLGAGAQRTYQ
jgi:Flp pilus assembly protein TadG